MTEPAKRESPKKKESVVLCEGYHDRAFWAGWLEHLGCVNPGLASDGTGRLDVRDPWGVRVTGPAHGFQSNSGRFIRVVACKGRRQVRDEFRRRLDEESQRMRQRAAEPRLAHLVVNVDSDVKADGTSTETGIRRRDVHDLAREYDSSAVEAKSGGLLLFDGRVRVSLISWTATDEPTDGLPCQQTLERLVCAALVGAYPDRGPAVQRWLDGRPDANDAGPKEFAWSYMAGWYADAGCEAFYRVLWSRNEVVDQLRPRLEQTGAWQIAEALAE